MPTLERDAAGFVEALRGRGVSVEGARGRARLLSPLLAGSLERALNLAEAMEARGFGRAGRTRAPSPPWTRLDRIAVVAGAVLVAALSALAGADLVLGVLWGGSLAWLVVWRVLRPITIGVRDGLSDREVDR